MDVEDNHTNQKQESPGLTKNDKKKRIMMVAALYILWTVALLFVMLLRKESLLNILLGMQGHFVVILATNQTVHKLMEDWQSDLVMTAMFFFFICACFLRRDMVRAYLWFYLITFCRLELISHKKRILNKKTKEIEKS